MPAAARRVRAEEWRGAASVVAVLGTVAILYLARDTFIPLAFAITLALILSPAVAWLERHGLHRVAGAFLMTTLALILTLGVSYVVFNQLLQVVNELPTYRERISKKVRAFRHPSDGAFGRAAKNVEELRHEFQTPETASELPVRTRGANGPPIPVQVIEPMQEPLAYLRDLVEPFIGRLTMFGIVLVFTIFLLIDQSDLRNRLFKLAGVSRLNVMTQAVDEATRRVSRYLVLQFAVNLGFGVLVGLGLWAIGVPYAVLWAGLAALARIIPYVGAFIAALLPLLLCLAVFDDWQQPTLVILLFGTLEVITANFLEPWLYGSQTGISSLALLLTTIFWATLWGPAGLILSTPLTVCVVVLGRHVKQLAFLHTLLGDEPVLSPDAQFYQRLLAMNDQDARFVLQEYGQGRSRLELYDSVVLPALSMAELDRHQGALPPEREEFIFLSVSEVLAEMSEKAAEEGVRPRPVPFAGRLLHIAAHDAADELAAAMLAQLLERSGRVSINFPLGVDLKEMLTLVQPTRADIFCVSSVPPFAFTEARSVSAILRTQFPETKLLAGVWGFSGDLDRALQRFGTAKPDRLVANFAGALDYVESVARQALSDSRARGFASCPGDLAAESGPAPGDAVEAPRE